MEKGWVGEYRYILRVGFSLVGWLVGWWKSCLAGWLAGLWGSVPHVVFGRMVGGMDGWMDGRMDG
jgi:hypothetical protein